MSDLFRPEAVAHATRGVSGNVVLAIPLSASILGGLLSTLIFLALLFACFTTYARKETVAGWLVPDKGLVRTIARAPGVVYRIYIKEGAVVAQGDKLAELDLGTESSIGNVGDAIARSLAAEALAMKAKIQAQRERLEAERERASARLVSLQSELEHARLQSTLQEERLRLARDLAAKSQDLADKGVLAKREYDARRSASFSAEQDLSALRRQVASLEREIVETRGRIAAIPIEIASVIAEGGAAEATLLQRSADAEARRMQTIVAPIAGRVAVLPLSDGQAVSAGSLIAVLTPTGGKLEAELLVPSRAIGFIRAGQPVHLMLQAFPHERFGTVRGSVQSVSTTVLASADIAVPGLSLQEPIFRVRVGLEKETVMAYGNPIALQPGMLLAADVVLDRRSLVGWLFDPIYAVRRRS